jgi:hypothetical protein
LLPTKYSAVLSTADLDENQRVSVYMLDDRTFATTGTSAETYRKQANEQAGAYLRSSNRRSKKGGREVSVSAGERARRRLGRGKRPKRTTVGQNAWIGIEGIPESQP